jgi:hypothetical protein
MSVRRQLAAGKQLDSHTRQRVRARCSFESANPQNVPPPLYCPLPELTAVEAVRLQLDSVLANNDFPRPQHGIHVLYGFARDGGAMERSKYFGLSKDLYHVRGEPALCYMLEGTY